MQFDPHVLHQILLKIKEQMRCPQCSHGVDVHLPSVKLASDDFILLQLKCEHCSAYIVLHVTLTGKEFKKEEGSTQNVSSQLELSKDELDTLRTAIESSGGSFEKLFKAPKADNPSGPSRFV